MGKKETQHKRCHTSKKKNKIKLDTGKPRSRHKAGPDSSDSFSTSDTSSTSSSDYEHKQYQHRKWHGTKHPRSDSIVFVL